MKNVDCSFNSLRICVNLSLISDIKSLNDIVQLILKVLPALLCVKRRIRRNLGFSRLDFFVIRIFVFESVDSVVYACNISVNLGLLIGSKSSVDLLEHGIESCNRKSGVKRGIFRDIRLCKLNLCVIRS